MSSNEALYEVCQDLCDLGLVSECMLNNPYGLDPFEAVEATRKINGNLPPESFNPKTKFGRTVGTVMSSLIEFADHPLVTSKVVYACAFAETYLEDMTKDREGNPIIVLSGHHPVAIIKSIGDATAYALGNSVTHGLVKRTISLPLRTLDPLFLPSLPSNVYAHSIQLDEIGEFKPIRFAITALPKSARFGRWSNTFSGITHNEIRSFAEQSMHASRPITPEELTHAQAETERYYMNLYN